MQTVGLVDSGAESQAGLEHSQIAEMTTARPSAARDDVVIGDLYTLSVMVFGCAAVSSFYSRWGNGMFSGAP